MTFRSEIDYSTIEDLEELYAKMDMGGAIYDENLPKNILTLHLDPADEAKFQTMSKSHFKYFNNENEYVSTDYVLKRHDGRWSLYQKASDVEMLRSQSLEPDITKNTKWNWIHRGEKTTEMTINFRIN